MGKRRGRRGINAAGRRGSTGRARGATRGSRSRDGRTDRARHAQAPRPPASGRVPVDVVGEGTTEVAVEAEATYADLARAVGYSPHEVTALVDDEPVPDDAPVAADRVRVLRLVKGGVDGDAGRRGRRATGGAADFCPPAATWRA